MRHPERITISPRYARTTASLDWRLPTPVSLHPFVAAGRLLPVSGNPVTFGFLCPMTGDPDVLPMRPCPVSFNPNSLWTWARGFDLLFRWRRWLGNIYNGGAAEQESREDDDAQDCKKEFLHIPPPFSALSLKLLPLSYFRLLSRLSLCFDQPFCC